MLRAELVSLGARLRSARLSCHRTAQDLADQAGMTRVTLRRVEAGDPAVTIGSYLKVLACLGLSLDFVTAARDDVAGRHLSAEPSTPRLRAGSTRRIRLADYPMLREIAWSTDPSASLSPEEALALYERNWRHLDHDSMGSRERDLVNRLTATVGKGVLLV
ncbi:MAG: helix-turn-helix transcriptional regulator [Burkholderiaceae bacterium]